MDLALGVAGVLVLLFGFVVMFGAPYLPTLKKQQEEALDLLELKPGQVLLELGSGDGRMLNAAAKRGIYAIGYELNPLLVLYSWLATRRNKGLVKVRWANFWTVRLPECDGIYVFLLDRYMTKLYKKITQEKRSSVKLVSLAFPVKDLRPARQTKGMYLYKID